LILRYSSGTEKLMIRFNPRGLNAFGKFCFDISRKLLETCLVQAAETIGCDVSPLLFPI
jgi:hypothetical protein